MTHAHAEAEKSTRNAAGNENSHRVPGFVFATAQSAQKRQGVDDVALIFSRTQATAAAMFTRNRVRAAPVILSEQRIRKGTARAVIVNSGNANACTGEAGIIDVRGITSQAAVLLAIDPDDVLVASTGVIGKRLNVAGLEVAMPRLVSSLHEDNLHKVACAIMTTDTVPKLAGRTGIVGNVPFTVCGIGKGAGMMRPDMATMLVFIMTDLALDHGTLSRVLKNAVDRSFHRINIDGDTSTNDSVIVLANGRAGNDPALAASDQGEAEVQRAFDGVADELARMMVLDAEGATKFVELVVTGARDNEQAARIAHTIAESKLVKTAFFGQDANWGRIVAAAGRSGVEVNPEMDVSFDDTLLVKDGAWTGDEAEKAATACLKQRSFRVTVDVKTGPGEAVVYTSDLSLDYVRINADYRT